MTADDTAAASVSIAGITPLSPVAGDSPELPAVLADVTFAEEFDVTFAEKADVTVTEEADVRELRADVVPETLCVVFVVVDFLVVVTGIVVPIGFTAYIKYSLDIFSAV